MASPSDEIPMSNIYIHIHTREKEISTGNNQEWGEKKRME